MELIEKFLIQIPELPSGQRVNSPHHYAAYQKGIMTINRMHLTRSLKSDNKLRLENMSSWRS